MPDAPPAALDPADFKCAVCLDLLYKPVVPSTASCAHAFCFWCLHQCMSPWGTSRCPLDRGAFTHMPAVCKTLHRTLALAFPDAYAARAAEAAAEEARTGAASESCGPLPAPGRPLEASDLACAACGRLLRKPVALNCGCTVCAPCVPPGRACSVCASAAVVAPPRVCRLLDDMIAKLFPAQAAERAADSDGDDRVPSTAPDAAAPTSAASFAETHPGIGCDACGAYPIVGRRYRCADCHAAVPRGLGYDLCGACADAPGLVGSRFGGDHTAEHELEAVPAPRTALHAVAAAHPELSLEQVLALVQMARDGGDGDGGGANDDDDGDDPNAHVVHLELDPARLPPGFPAELATIGALEAFFGRIEAAGGLAGIDGDTRDVLARFFPEVLRVMQAGGGGGEEEAATAGGNDDDDDDDVEAALQALVQRTQERDATDALERLALREEGGEGGGEEEGGDDEGSES